MTVGFFFFKGIKPMRTKKRGDEGNILQTAKPKMVLDLPDLRNPNSKSAMRKGKKQNPLKV